MKNRIKLCLQVAWVTMAVVVLVMGFNLCTATDQACFDVSDRMSLGMVILSFPSGFLSVVVTSFFFEPTTNDRLNEYMFFWWVMSGAGYIQWFVLVPRLFAKPKFTTLGLESKIKIEKETTTEVAPPRGPKTKRVRSIQGYDKHGRTPLERALRARSTNASS